MPILIAPLDDKVIRCTVRGELGYAEFRGAQSEIEKLIQERGRVRLLCVLDGFAGWEQSERWSDSSVLDIEKIAVIGDPGWKDEALAFLGAGFRPSPVRYFEPGDAVRAADWLRGEP